MIYLQHYHRPLRHAHHYLGFTDDLDARTARHPTGFGGRLRQSFPNWESLSRSLVRGMALPRSNM
jgi:hypothetical protein